MPQLFHVSDISGIRRFAPRPDRQGRLRVWAIAQSHLANYLLPRECPRVTFHRRVDTTARDADRFLKGARHVVVIETGWEQQAESAQLALYEMPTATFQCYDPNAGYFISTTAVEPINEMIITNPLQQIRSRGVEVRAVPCLWQLREDVVQSSLGFSIIRFRNAAPPPEGFVSRFAVTRA